MSFLFHLQTFLIFLLSARFMYYVNFCLSDFQTIFSGLSDLSITLVLWKVFPSIIISIYIIFHLTFLKKPEK